ncbi:MAG: hypothetical protein H7A25_12985 [Leptospiraceae bacterium]|nr:hypothetical protein [Leptospiraceae bacterium]MCP5500815.1 hypothetical protein [Leptospiraceae bacterium]
MLKFLFTIFLIFPILYFPLNAYVFDMKTHIGEKTDLLPLKIGTAFFLKAAGHTLFSVDEDYAVWLKNYKKEKKDGVYSVEFTVSVNKPSLLLEKQSLYEKRLAFTYKEGENHAVEMDTGLLGILKDKLKHYSVNAYQEASIGGSMASKEVLSFLKEKDPEGKGISN